MKNNVYYDYANKIYAETLNLKGIDFYYKIKPKDNFFYFKQKLSNQRFDTISYAINTILKDFSITGLEIFIKNIRLEILFFLEVLLKILKHQKKY